VAPVPGHQNELPQQAAVGGVVELLEAAIDHGPVLSSAAPLATRQETRQRQRSGSLGVASGSGAPDCSLDTFACLEVWASRSTRTRFTPSLRTYGATRSANVG